MYESFFGFSALPFSLLPDADFMYLSKRHRRAINLLEYGILSQAGFVVITGEVGAGKTTVIRHFIKSSHSELTVGVVSNPSPNSESLLERVLVAFDGIEPATANAQNYDRFVQFLLQQYAARKRVVLIVDEAQNLKQEALEELRMLSNVNNEKDQLLQMILVGQPELLDTLKRPELRQFKQRISVHCHLNELTPAETAAYIRHRLSVVGGSAEIFPNESCATVYYLTGGVPRLINLLCDQVLVYAFSEDYTTVIPSMVLEVVEDRERSGLSAFRPLPANPEEQEAFSQEINALLQQMKQ